MEIIALLGNLIALIWGQSYVEGLRVSKIVKGIKLEEFWGDLEANRCFQRQSFAKYLRLTVIFIWNSELLAKFNF